MEMAWVLKAKIPPLLTMRLTLLVVSRWNLGAKAKAAAKKPPCQTFDFSQKTGAGEGIRTLDPNLGKVVLYP